MHRPAFFLTNPILVMNAPTRSPTENRDIFVRQRSFEIRRIGIRSVYNIGRRPSHGRHVAFKWRGDPIVPRGVHIKIGQTHECPSHRIGEGRPCWKLFMYGQKSGRHC